MTSRCQSHQTLRVNPWWPPSHKPGVVISGKGQPSQFRCSVGRVGASLSAKNVKFLYCSPIPLYDPKNEVSPGCQGSVQGQLRDDWARYWFPETSYQHPYAEGFQGCCRQWVKTVSQDDSKPCQCEYEGTEGSQQECTLAGWTLESLCGCCHSARNSLHLHSWLSDAGEWRSFFQHTGIGGGYPLSIGLGISPSISAPGSI